MNFIEKVIDKAPVKTKRGLTAEAARQWSVGDVEMRQLIDAIQAIWEDDAETD